MKEKGIGTKTSVFERKDEELQQAMENHFTDSTYRVYFDVLLLRHYEYMLKETRRLAKTTWYLAIATWVLVVVTILVPFITKLLNIK